jgi:hypothetical protein
MKAISLIFVIGWVLYTPVRADEKKGFREIVVPNFDSDSPACRVQFPLGPVKCDNESCDVPAPKQSSLKSIKVSLSCIPNSANTGFESPPEDAKIYPIRAQNVNGNVLLIDELIPGPSGKMRELLFCLYGRRATFCGNANTMLLKDGGAADGSKNVVTFVETMILIESEAVK